MLLRFWTASRRDAGDPPEPRNGSQEHWPMAWALGWTEMVSWGILFYAFSVLLVPMQNEFGWSAGLITGAYSLSLLVSGILAPFVGRWIDRRGARWLMTTGSVLATVLVIAWSRVDSWLSFYLIWVGIGIAMSMTLYEPGFAAIAPWFTRNRAKALLIVTFFGGLASTVFLPLTGWLEVRFGWREALLILAGVLAINTILPHALVLRGAPEATSRGRSFTPSSWKSLLRSAWFQRLSIAYFLQMFVTAGISVHMIAYLLHQDVSPTTAAFIAGSVGIFQTIARVLVTIFEKSLSVEAMTVLMFILQMLAIALLILMPTGFAVYIAAAMLGIPRGAVTLLRPAILLQHFAVQEFGAVNGTLAAILTIAGALAPVATGIAVGLVGDYDWIFVFFGVASLVAAIVLWSTRYVAAPSTANAP